MAAAAYSGHGHASGMSQQQNRATGGGGSQAAGGGGGRDGGGQLFEAYVTFVDMKEPILTISVQFDKEAVRLMNAEMTKIGKDLFGKMAPPPLDALTLNTDVVAKDEENIWYRAKVTATDFVKQQIQVNLVDFGHALDKLSPASVRLLAGPQYEEVLKEAPLSFACILKDVRAIGPGWSREAAEYLSQQMCFEDVVLEIFDMLDAKPVVELYLRSDPARKPLSMRLIEERFAIFAPSKVPHPHQPILPQTEPQIGSEQSVTLSHFVDGPKKFYVQLHQSITDPTWQQMFGTMQAFQRKPLANPGLGDLCLIAIPDGPASRVCRGEILEQTGQNDGARVFVVDYGFNYTAPVGTLAELPSEFMQLPRLAIPCALSQAELMKLSAMALPQAISESFQRMVKGKLWLAMFMQKGFSPSDGSEVYEVHIMNQQTRESITTLMENEFLKQQAQSKATPASFMQQLGAGQQQQQHPAQAAPYAAPPPNSLGMGAAGSQAAASIGGAGASHHPNSILAQAMQHKQKQQQSFYGAQAAAHGSVSSGGFTPMSSSAVGQPPPNQPYLQSIRQATAANYASHSTAPMAGAAASNTPLAAFINAKSFVPQASQAVAVPKLAQPQVSFPLQQQPAQFYSVPPVPQPPLPASVQQPRPSDLSLGGAAYGYTAPPPKQQQQFVEPPMRQQSYAPPMSHGQPQMSQAAALPQGAYHYRPVKQRHRDLCVVTHIIDPENFFVQLASDREDLNDLMHSLQDAYKDPDNAKYYSAVNLNVNSPCAFYYAPNWYRGLVKEISSMNFMKIQGVDYGNLERIPISAVRQLKPEFLRISPFAMECRLFSVSPRGIWSDAERELFEQTVMPPGQERLDLMCLFHEETEPRVYTVELFTKDKVNLNHEFGRMTNTLVGEAATAAASVPRQLPMAAGGLLGVAAASAVQPMRLPKYQVSMLTQQQVTVSYLQSPMEFWVQSEVHREQICEMQTQLNKRYQALRPGEAIITGPLAKDQLCCARFQQDSNWYRATVTADFAGGQDNVGVYFVDFGNSDVVPRADVKQLLPEFVNFPEFAFKCQITGIRPLTRQWPQEALDEFQTLQDCTIQLRFLSLNAVSGAYEVAFVNGSIPPVIENLLQLNLLIVDDPSMLPSGAATASASRYVAANQMPSHAGVVAHAAQGIQLSSVIGMPPLTIPTHIGGSVEGVVAFVENVKKIYIQLKDQSAAIDTLQSQMQDFYANDTSTLNALLKGALVAAKFAEPEGDNQWYRAVVEERLTPSKLLVTFLDYGNSAEVLRFEQTKPLPQQFRVLPPQAICCALSGVSNSKANTEFFKEITAKCEDAFTVRFDTRINDTLFNVSLLRNVRGQMVTFNDVVNQPTLMPQL